MGLEEQDKCIDPEYQRKLNKDSLNLPSSTFYPKGTICYKNPSASKYLIPFSLPDTREKLVNWPPMF